MLKSYWNNEKWCLIEFFNWNVVIKKEKENFEKSDYF